MDPRTFIYGLKDPNSAILRYIGKSNKPSARFAAHCKPNPRGNSHLKNWLVSLKLMDKAPLFMILREVPKAEWQEWEQRYIRCARSLGFPLVNATDGGDGIENPTPETRRKMGAAQRGEKHYLFGKHPSYETRQKLSRAAKGRSLTMQHRAKISNALKGVHRSKTWIENQRKAQTGRKMSDTSRARMSERQRGPRNANYGRPMSEEQKAKLRASMTGRQLTPEHRAKISAGQMGHQRCLGHKHTPEHNLKISLANKGVRNPRWGVKLSLETKAKISAARRRRYAPSTTELAIGIRDPILL